MGFPLLHLPPHANKRALQLMTLQEKFLLSTCSQQSQSAIQSCPIKNLRLDVEVQELRYRLMVPGMEPLIIDTLPQDFEPEVEHLCWSTQIDKTEVKAFIENESNIRSYWPNNKYFFNSTLTTMLGYLSKVFNKPKLHLRFTADSIKRAMIITRILKLDVWKVNLRPWIGSGEDMIQSMLRECKDVELITCNSNSQLERPLPYKPSEPMRTKRFLMGHADGIPMDLVTDMLMGCETLSIPNGPWDSKDLNKFFRAWIDKKSQLNFAQLPGKMENFQECLDGIPREMVTEAVLHGGIQTFAIGTCYMIRQASGKEALVFSNGSCYHLCTDFHMNVGNEEEFESDGEEEEQ